MVNIFSVWILEDYIFGKIRNFFAIFYEKCKKEGETGK